jgi:peroxiredoxin
VSLSDQLENTWSEFARRTDSETVCALLKAEAALGPEIRSRALKAGQRAPDFRLTDPQRGVVRLGFLLRAGPVVISFNRGAWCPYCVQELEALARVRNDVERLRGTIVTVVPSSERDASEATYQPHGFPNLHDIDCRTADTYGLAYHVPDALSDVYAKLGVDLPLTADGKRLLPIPATYVVDTNGTIALAYVDADYRKRLDPSEIVCALYGLRARRPS